jgi:hypothetical protein
MIEIFIPVLWVCINTNCEFMQADGYFTKEEQCELSIENEKQHIHELVRRAGQGTITVLEGTCVDATVKGIYEKRVKDERQ